MTHQTPIFDPMVAKMHAFTSRLLILSIIAVAVSSAVNVYASPVDLYNGNTLVPGSFTDVGEAINSNLDGNKIVISGDNATHNVTATNSARSTLTVRGDSDSSQRTISVGTDVLYNFSEQGNYQFTFENLKYQGTGGGYDDFYNSGFVNYQGTVRRLIHVQGEHDPSSSLQLTLNNTTVSNFGYNVISASGGVSIVDSENATFTENCYDGFDTHSGGVIYSGHDFLIDNSKNITFSKNYLPSGQGGAIYSEGKVTISNSEDILFDRNFGYRWGAWGVNGVAIYSKSDFTISNSKNVVFDSQDTMNGPASAIYCEGNVYIDDSTVEILSNGGHGTEYAIVARNIYFSGDNSNVKFHRNWAYDVELVKQNEFGDYIKSELSFTDNGVYTFGSGIYHQEINASSYADNSTTKIDKAHVSITSSCYDLYNYEGTYYYLRAASISNGGTLTATLDHIDVLNGFFNLDSTAKMELNVVDAGITKKLTMYNDNSASVTDSELVIQGSGKLSKSGAGTLQILAEANGLVSAESFVVSSGRLDYKGYFTGDVKVSAENNESNPIFSPGNSVGEANVTGDVIIDNGLILFEFGAYPGSDSNHDVLNITNGRFSAGEGMINLYFESGDVESWAAEEKFEYLLVSGAGLGYGEYTSMLNPSFTDYFKLLGKNGNLYLVDTSPIPEQVPEPATWALLILGAVGALYFRKRVSK
ncbi:MAG: PEP-CTERM sorting domain-containing protein [Thermoguttaceae bacterium]|nr:PEP-CTERM sorting domain-containing protein [Thermoguttaceae bacterium]